MRLALSFLLASLVIASLGCAEAPRRVELEFEPGSLPSLGFLPRAGEPVAVRARVTTSAGPRPRSRVTLTGAPGPVTFIPESILTGDDGTALFYFISPETAPFVLGATSLDASTSIVLERDDRTVPVTLALAFPEPGHAAGVLPSPGEIVPFTVTATRGETPAPDVALTLASVPVVSLSPSMAVTDADGQVEGAFAVPSDVDSVLVQVTAEGGQTSFRLSTPRTPATVTFEFPAGTPAASGTLAAERQLVLGTVVVRRDGEAVAGQPVVLESAPDLAIVPDDPVTGADGRVDFYFASPERPTMTSGATTVYIDELDVVLRAQVGSSVATATLRRR